MCARQQALPDQICEYLAITSAFFDLLKGQMIECEMWEDLKIRCEGAVAPWSDVFT